MFDLAVIGHYTIDQIITKEVEPKPTLGGPPTYTSIAARRMGATVTVISKVGKDFPDEYIAWLSRNGIDLTGLARVDTPTTRFISKYENEERVLQLKSVCSSILPEDIPKDLKTKCIHLGPVAREIPVETVSHAAKTTKVVSLDPQGFVRRFDREGHVLDQERLEVTMLRHIDILKASEKELKIAMGIDDPWKAAEAATKFGPGIVIITKGVKGALMLHDHARYEIPAYKPKSIIDPTGAGDAFIGAFMAEYVRGKDPSWCVAVGAATSSFVVEGLGPSSFESKNDVLKRAERIFQLIKKL